MEAGWLRGAAVLVERGEDARRSARAAAVWLEELAPEARARKATLLSRWVAAAGDLRAALHAHDSERGPLTEALFPEWREASLRRHVDQALALEAELQRRRSSAYVTRRLAEPATEKALRPALDALAAAQDAWSSERDRPALAGPEADEARRALLAVADETGRTLDRLRAVVRAALVERPDLLQAVFPGRARTAVDGPERVGSSAAPDQASPGRASPADDTPASAGNDGAGEPPPAPRPARPRRAHRS